MLSSTFRSDKGGRERLFLLTVLLIYECCSRGSNLTVEGEEFGCRRRSILFAVDLFAWLFFPVT